MKDKYKLKKLVEIIGELLKEEGNEWLADEILKTIGKTSPVEEIAKNSFIQNIHEYCVEQKIEKQAKEFYASFPITEIKEQLIQDYRKMEHERRRDDFDGFCLCMFQQIEAIVNFLFESNNLKSRLNRDRESSAFIEWDPTLKSWDRKSTQRLIPFLLIKKNKYWEKNNSLPFFDLAPKEEDKYFDQEGFPIVNYNPSKKSWSFLNRLRTVLFYYYFNSKLRQIEFEGIYKPGKELYTIRNKNHRESKATPNQQRVIDEVCKNESRYYFKFYGFLQDFLSRIETSYPSTSSHISNANKESNERKFQKNTIGANNPELEKLKRQMNKNE